MMINKKHIFRKLIKDGLSEEERSTLNSTRQFAELIGKQWEDAPDFTRYDNVDGELIWDNIREITQEGHKNSNLLIYKIYSIAASILLILGLGVLGWMIMNEPGKTSMFVVYSGIQNIKSVKLPDGSTVQLGPSSKLTYPASFTGNKREILLEGQAFFDVEKDKSKPFIVKTRNMDVTAVGTAFEVYSYETDNNIETVLLNGKVRINTEINNRKAEFFLSPNEKLTFSRSSGRLAIEKVDASKYTDWRNHGILSFENEKLSMIIPRLEQWYGRNVICQKDIADKFRFTFKVRDDSLERILFMLNSSSPIKYHKVGEDFELYLDK